MLILILMLLMLLVLPLLLCLRLTEPNTNTTAATTTYFADITEISSIFSSAIVCLDRLSVLEIITTTLSSTLDLAAPGVTLARSVGIPAPPMATTTAATTDIGRSRGRKSPYSCRRGLLPRTHCSW